MILIALGANLPGPFGAPEDTLREAQAELGRRNIRITRSSSIWLTAPVPVSDQPWYRNAVVAVDTALSIPALLQVLKQIEADFGRQGAVRNASRILDLDIIAWHDEIFTGSDLEVPHPRAHERSFVLYPLQEVSPHWMHPVLKRDISSLIRSLPANQKTEQAIRKLTAEAA